MKSFSERASCELKGMKWKKILVERCFASLLSSDCQKQLLNDQMKRRTRRNAAAGRPPAHFLMLPVRSSRRSTKCIAAAFACKTQSRRMSKPRLWHSQHAWSIYEAINCDAPHSSFSDNNSCGWIEINFFPWPWRSKRSEVGGDLICGF